jgi:hypothetical protein
MKTKLTVEIDIDTERDGATCLAGTHIPGLYQIEVRKDIMDAFGASPLSPGVALAHELGHLIAHVFQMPGSVREPRPLYPNQWGQFVPDYSLRVLASEKEAWDVAELIFQTKHAKIEALKTYEKGFKLWE